MVKKNKIGQSATKTLFESKAQRLFLGDEGHIRSTAQIVYAWEKTP